MNKILFTLELLLVAMLPRAACAQAQVFTAYSSATSCNFAVSTSAPVRVDNFNGACTGLLTGRTHIRIANISGDVYGGFNLSLSTKIASANYGEKIAASQAAVDLDIASNMAYYLMAATAGTAPTVTIEQFKPNFMKSYFP